MIVVFGGSFNPPTIAHINILKELYNDKSLNIEKIIIVPVSNKYEKDNLIEFKHRYNMLKIATEKYDFIEVSDIDNILQRSMKTYEVLNYINKRFKYKTTIGFLLGADNFNCFNQWINSEYILKNYYLLVIEREGFNVLSTIKNNKILFENKNKIKIIKADDSLFTISSTKVRNNIKDLSKIKLFLDDLVLDYIEKNNLYHIRSDIYDK